MERQIVMHFELAESVNDLVKDAAKRARQSKRQFVISQMERIASEEYARQQAEGAE